jgi:hypothetical protein
VNECSDSGRDLITACPVCIAWSRSWPSWDSQHPTYPHSVQTRRLNRLPQSWQASARGLAGWSGTCSHRSRARVNSLTATPFPPRRSSQLRRIAATSTTVGHLTVSSAPIARLGGIPMSASLVASSMRLLTEAVTSSGSGSRDAGEDRWPAAMSRAELSGLGGCGSLPPGGGVLPLVALGTSPRQGRRRQVAVVPAADPPAGPAWEGLDRISRAVQGALQDDPSGVVHGIAIATPHPRQPRESPACTRTRPWSERRGFATTMPLRRAELREAVVNACPRMSAAIRRSVPAGRQAGRRCHPTAPTPPRS